MGIPEPPIEYRVAGFALAETFFEGDKDLPSPFAPGIFVMLSFRLRLDLGRVARVMEVPPGLKKSD
jgi:hypothetical protein